MRKTHYPDYDLLAPKDEWDPLTREVVLHRLGPFPPKQYFSDSEEELMRVIAEHLVYDERDDIIDWILHYMDARLASRIGESHRKPNVPAEALLVREGLKAIDSLTDMLHSKKYTEVKSDEQVAILASLQQGFAPEIPEWAFAPQKDLFKKFLELTVEAYYSHPIVWQEIGHGGPAYPRGYYRIELGWIDPWEAKRSNGE